MSKEPSVYDRLKAAGCEMDNHYSDLYVENTDIARKIVIGEFGLKPKHFVCQVSGKMMMELPFMYQPFWEQKTEAK